MDIVQYPDPILSTLSAPLEIANTAEIAAISKQLCDAYELLPSTKVGLAAPQIGINKRIAIVLGNIVVNPVLKPARQSDFGIEGCFSIEHAKPHFNVE